VLPLAMPPSVRAARRQASSSPTDRGHGLRIDVEVDNRDHGRGAPVRRRSRQEAPVRERWRQPGPLEAVEAHGCSGAADPLQLDPIEALLGTSLV
jgi:hypothetical protein